MPSLRNAALGLAVIASVASASDVEQLKKDTFEPFVKDNDLVLAEFFAPWCGHCKALAPEYEEAATTLKEKNIALAKVDCTEEAELCESFGVNGYPTLKVFRGTENITPYGGQRKAPAIISYMTKQSLPAVSPVTKDTLEEFKTADKVVLVAYFDAKDSKSNETFTGIANSMRDNFLFGATNDADLAKGEGVKQPGIVLYKQFDEGKDIFTEKFTTENVEKFAKTASVPLIGEVGPETYADYMAAGIPLAYIFAETPEERESLSADLKPIATKHKGKINIATIDAKAFGQHAGNLNLEAGNWPAFGIQDMVKNTKYPMAETGKKALSAKSVGKFVDDFLAGKISPSVKSEPVPEKQEGAVTVVVANNYEEVVMDDKKDVLVEYYAPWCGHCKALAPKYDELASLYTESHQSLVTVAKIDATANDVPIEVAGFPTIKLFPAGKKEEPIDYQGPRTVEDLAQFIAENGSHHATALTSEEGKEGVDDAAASKTGSESTVQATDNMQHQAPAATVAKSAASKVAEAAASVVEGASGGDSGDMDNHDEL
ncbi:MAG: protein disulfide-isomerase precursor [Chrysothrix sp. TS-e1954]|nr:MAG: protein disulfide-isomerase precursor [Chrysothrix sp. TS-e1954]